MNAAPVHGDFETRSANNLRDSGLHRYCEDPTTGVWVLRYAWTRDDVKEWRPGMPDPQDLLDYIAAGGIFKAHNSAFERHTWNTVIRKWYPHWPELKIEQMDCTMARAAAVSLPQSLGELGSVLGTKEQKDKEGHALMMKMCRPRSILSDGSIQWWDAPDLQDRQSLYCARDVLTEFDVDEMVPPLTDYEQKVWHLDQYINDRGIPIDTVAVQKCALLVDVAKKEADKEMRRLTNRVVPKCTNDNKLIEWIASRGIDCTTVKKSEQTELMFIADLRGDPLVRTVIELRGDAKKTSVAKYAAMMKCVGSDGRIRGLLNYHGAGPGRWAGRLVQPQNFPRLDYKKEGHIIRGLIDMLHSNMTPTEIYDTLALVYGESGKEAPLRLMSRALRSMISAPAGMKFVGGDFSNIEGRVNAWLAGETWKLDAFMEYDMGIGPDLYKVTAGRIAGKEVDAVDDDERQAIGKTPELACGYQGGVGAFVSMADIYAIDLYAVSSQVRNTTDEHTWNSMRCKYAKAKDKCGLQEKEWTAIKIIVAGWRDANCHIVQMWWDLQDAAIEAVQHPGNVVRVAKVSYYSDGRFLWCTLPSGRMICYSSPMLEEEAVDYEDKWGVTKTRIRKSVSFYGYKEGQWRKQYLYGGLQCENIVQAIARDIMVDRMFAAEANGYTIILTVHDELLTEVKASRTDLNEKHFEGIMSILPEWAEGLPLAAKAWEDTRYIK